MRHPNHRTPVRALITIFFLLGPSTIILSVSEAAEKVSPVLLADVVIHQADQLAAVESNSGAMTLFTTTIGPALGLNDVAKTLAAKGLPAKMVKDLAVPELTQSVHQLIASLAAWQLSDRIRKTSDDRGTSVIPPAALLSTARQEWMATGSHITALADLFRLSAEPLPSEHAQPAAHPERGALLLAAYQVALEAHQQAIASWWELYEWKDRVRQAKGQARLCGTWHWVIHNHQNHGEKKAPMIFPPAGQRPPNVPLPAETIILGDSIYLRWEHEGLIQEDSLLFTSEGARIEGSFVNNTGGWGSIAGKRTGACQPYQP
jgi:hypothetical protein